MKIFFFSVLLLVFSFNAHPQVGIGTTNPDQSAALDVQSTSQGLLPPRLTAQQRDGIFNPAAGLMIWCSDCGERGQLQVFDGLFWTDAVGNLQSAEGFSNNQVGQNIDGNNSALFAGTSVAMDLSGNRIIVGSPGGASQVEVFEYDGSIWNLLGNSFTGPGNTGQAVDISEDGNRIAISAPNDTSNNGSVAIFEWDGNTWNQLGDKIVAPSGETDTGYGTAVALSGDGSRIIIGYPQFDNGTNSPNNNNGLVQVFEWDGATWIKIGNDIIGNAGEVTGTAVDINLDGTRIAITDSGLERARVFVLTSVSTWFGQSLSIGQPGDFGRSLSFNRVGDLLAVSTSTEDCPGISNSNCGSVYFFEVEANVQPSSTSLSATFTGQRISGNPGEFLGFDISISANADRLIAGGNLANSEQGIARMFQLNGTDWNQVGSDILGLAIPDRFGTSVGISGNGFRAVIGAPETNGTDQDGYVQVFE
mgnify:CR=1 FL=1